jgi:hypothetical protein
MSDDHMSGYATSPLSQQQPAEGRQDLTEQTVVNLNEVRAIRTGNSTLWSPKEAAEKLLRDIREGKRNPTVMYICVSEDAGDRQKIYHYCAGGTNMEYLGLLHYHISDLARDGE